MMMMVVVVVAVVMVLIIMIMIMVTMMMLIIMIIMMSMIIINTFNKFNTFIYIHTRQYTASKWWFELILKVHFSFLTRT